MIITLNMDTEKDRDTCKKVLELVLSFGGSVELEVLGKDKAVKNVYEAARRRISGEKVVWETDLSELPCNMNRRRGRPRKEAKEKA